MKWFNVSSVEDLYFAGCFSYFVEIFVSSTNNIASEIEVGVHRSNAPYNAAQTAWGRDEKQTITTSTIVQPEIQVCGILNTMYNW